MIRKGGRITLDFIEGYTQNAQSEHKKEFTLPP